jgi:ABC-type phosphate/phosphonate transport system permease subunit
VRDRSGTRKLARICGEQFKLIGYIRPRSAVGWRGSPINLDLSNKFWNISVMLKEFTIATAIVGTLVGVPTATFLYFIVNTPVDKQTISRLETRNHRDGSDSVRSLPFIPPAAFGR